MSNAQPLFDNVSKKIFRPIGRNINEFSKIYKSSNKSLNTLLFILCTKIQTYMVLQNLSKTFYITFKFLFDVWYNKRIICLSVISKQIKRNLRLFVLQSIKRLQICKLREYVYVQSEGCLMQIQIEQLICHCPHVDLVK